MIRTIPLEIYDGNGKLLGFELAEEHVRDWFKKIDLELARDILNVCEGIIETRQSMQPKRARRKDAGKKRGPNEVDQASEDRKLFESTQG